MKILLDGNKNKYKANLHCHSTVSDGSFTPAELKELYMEQGYSIIAYTDHNLMIAHDELTDDKFLALHGYESGAEDKANSEIKGACHLCLIQRDPKNLNHVCFEAAECQWGNLKNYFHLAQYDKTLPEYKHVYTPECINDIIKTARDNGFFVTYNHPNWSEENYPIYSQYHGMHAMEICNYDCLVCGWDEYNPRVYDDMLRDGEKIYCIATDDNHNGGRKCNDSFGGFTVIFADKLEYTTVMDSLFDGNFYASQGPEIYSLVYDAGKIRIECSDAERIEIATAHRRRSAALAKDGKALRKAEFDVFDRDGYVRLTVIDKFGRSANTNAYFVEDLEK